MPELDLDGIIKKHKSEERNPEIAAHNFSLGEEAFEREDYIKAAEKFNIAFSNDPKKEYLRKKVDSIQELLEQKEYKELKEEFNIDKIIDELKAAIKFDPVYEVTYFILTYLLDKKGLTKEAVEESRIIGVLRPNISSCHHKLALYLNKMGETDEAISEYNKAIKLNPDSFSSHYNLGFIFLDKEEYDKASNEFKIAIELNPNDADSHFSLGVAYSKRGKKEEGIKEFREAIRLNPNDVYYHDELGTLLDKEGRRGEAIEEFREAIRLNPEKAYYHTQLGFLLNKEGKTGKAIEEFREAIRLEEDNATNHYILALVLKKVGKEDEAEKEYRAAISIDSDYSNAKESLADILVEKGIEGYSRWRSEDKLNADAYLFTEAKYKFEEAIGIDDSNAAAHVLLGEILQIEDRLDEAVDHYKRAIALNFEKEFSRHEQSILYLHIGLAFYNHGYTEKGISHLEKAIDLSEYITFDKKSKRIYGSRLSLTLYYMKNSRHLLGRIANMLDLGETGERFDALLFRREYKKPTDIMRNL